MAITGKIDRKYMAHFLDAGSLCGGSSVDYERLGKDLEEYNIELNPDTETSKNILGESTFKHNGYWNLGCDRNTCFKCRFFDS